MGAGTIEHDLGVINRAAEKLEIHRGTDRVYQS
jgi:hypothetical protein